MAKSLILLARLERFELPACGLEVRCSIQLSYRRSKNIVIMTAGYISSGTYMISVDRPFKTSLRTTFVFSSSCPKISATAFRRMRLSLAFSL